MEKMICAASILCSFSGVRPNLFGIPVFVGGHDVKNECAYCRREESPVWRKGFPMGSVGSGGYVMHANACNRCGLKEGKKRSREFK